MRRGDIVRAVFPREAGKPRPALVIQADWLLDCDSVLMCPFTTFQRDAPLFRLTVPATGETRLDQLSFVMVDKIYAVPLEKCREVIGRLPAELAGSLDIMLAAVIGLAD